jgi:hypothetical protein
MSVTPRELLDNETVREKLEVFHKLGFSLAQVKKTNPDKAQADLETECLSVINSILYGKLYLENEKKKLAIPTDSKMPLGKAVFHLGQACKKLVGVLNDVAEDKDGNISQDVQILYAAVKKIAAQISNTTDSEGEDVEQKEDKEKEVEQKEDKEKEVEQEDDDEEEDEDDDTSGPGPVPKGWKTRVEKRPAEEEGAEAPAKKKRDTGIRWDDGVFLIRKTLGLSDMVEVFDQSPAPVQAPAPAPAPVQAPAPVPAPVQAPAPAPAPAGAYVMINLVDDE